MLATITPIELLVGCAVLGLILYYYLTSTFDFWKIRNVKGPKPIPIFGNFKDVLLGNVFIAVYVKQIYDEYKNERMVGLFSRGKPVLVLRDPELIKDVLIKDFATFPERGGKIDASTEPLSEHLFNLEAERWRPMRSKLSPAFTSGKLKEMFYLLEECSEHLETYLKTAITPNVPIECREFTAKFTTDVIGMCAFGLQMNALADENSPFRSIGRDTMKPNRWRNMKVTLKDDFPRLYRLLKPIVYNSRLNDFFIGTMSQTMALREKTKIRRNDFVDLLLDIKHNPEKMRDIELSDTLLTSQAFVFFVAGFETSSTTMSNVLYELALHQSIQEKVRLEIEEILHKNEGKIKYETIKEMKYLDQVFRETLRKYPPGDTLRRKSIAKYTFARTNVTIPKDTSVWIPVYALQHDSSVYPNPEKFDPERFSDENNKKRNPMFYLPFGDGPRNCIGARFANYQSKVGLIKIIQNYNVDVCSKTCDPYVIDPKGIVLGPKNGIHLNFTPI